MIDCVNKVTHVRLVQDESKRELVLSKIGTYDHCSWNHTFGTRDGEKIDSQNDSFIVRVEVNEANDIPKIKKGDFFVLGECDIANKTSGKLLSEYPESFEVQTVKYNLNSYSGYNNHIKVQGL